MSNNAGARRAMNHPGIAGVVHPRMLVELSVATAMVLLTVLVQGIAMMLLSDALRRVGMAKARTTRLHMMTVPMLLTLGLLLAQGTEIWMYAFQFTHLGAVASRRSAIYFSTITDATISYGDAAIRQEWASVAAIEGINDIVLLHSSTAFLVSVMTRPRR